MLDFRKPKTESDFYFVEADDPETALARIVELVKTRIPRRFGFDPIRDVQVLCPMNRGGVGARSLNIELQAALNPAGEHKVESFGWTFAAGDKVMQIENDYDKEVYNGDVGYVTGGEPDGGELTSVDNPISGCTHALEPPYRGDRLTRFNLQIFAQWASSKACHTLSPVSGSTLASCRSSSSLITWWTCHSGSDVRSRYCARQRGRLRRSALRNALSTLVLMSSPFKIAAISHALFKHHYRISV
jgi:hypothetical protein